MQIYKQLAKLRIYFEYSKFICFFCIETYKIFSKMPR